MAVSLDVLTPADGTVEVPPNAVVEVELSDSVDLDPALLEITVDGTSCTVANGHLITWQGVDAKELHAVTNGLEWWTGPATSIAVVVIYNSATLDTIAWTSRETEWGDSDGGHAGFSVIDLALDYVRGEVAYGFSVIDLALDYVRGEVAYGVVDSMFPAAADAEFFVAHYVAWHAASSGVVGSPQITDCPSSAIVQGWTPSYCPASGLVQAWLRHDPPAAGIVGVRYCSEGPAAGIVGVVTTTHGVSAAVVYAVNRRNAVDVQVLDSTLYTTLTSLGVTWS